MRTSHSFAKKYERQKFTIKFLFLLPVFGFLAVFIFYSIYNSFHISLFDWGGMGKMTDFAGLKDWKMLLKDFTFAETIKNNLLLVVISVLGQTPIALALAYFLDIAGKKANIFKIVWFLPLLMSSVAIGTLFGFLLDPTFGGLTAILNLFGREGIPLLGNPDYALVTVAFVVVWRFVPLYMVYFLAGISSIPKEIYEAAMMDGANKSQYFFQCAIPQLMPTIRSALVLQMIGSMKHFNLIYIMTGGGPSGTTELMATYMYKETFPEMQMGYGSTVASAMFLIITLISITTIKLLRKEED